MSAQLHLSCDGHALCAAVMSWPDDVRCIRKAVLARSAMKSLPTDELTELKRTGLVNDHGNWTNLGAVISDLLEHEAFLEGDEVHGVLRQSSDAIKGSLLDVGCSTGWTLRNVPEASRRVGIDIDPVALTLGYRLAEAEGQNIEFRQASSHELPFADQTFDCVVCRNAITYTNQRRTLSEMTRVLRPNGMLFVRFENVRYDIQHVFSARSPRALACRLRDFAFGVMHTMTGWQAKSNTRISPGRMFGSKLRIGSYLRQSDCRVLQAADSLRCPRLFGRANQTSMLASKSA